MYMSGFFPCMMFGVLGAALAMVKTAKNKKAAIGLCLLYTSSSNTCLSNSWAVIFMSAITA